MLIQEKNNDLSIESPTEQSVTVKVEPCVMKLILIQNNEDF